MAAMAATVAVHGPPPAKGNVAHQQTAHCRRCVWVVAQMAAGKHGRHEQGQDETVQNGMDQTGRVPPWVDGGGLGVGGGLTPPSVPVEQPWVVVDACPHKPGPNDKARGEQGPSESTAVGIAPRGIVEGEEHGHGPCRTDQDAHAKPAPSTGSVGQRRRRRSSRETHRGDGGSNRSPSPMVPHYI